MQAPIKIKTSHIGSLHTLLGVKPSAKIPAADLKIKPDDSPAVKKKKQFALNAKSWSHTPATAKLMGK